MFFIYLVGLLCLAFSVGQCQAQLEMKHHRRHDEIKDIFEALEKKKDPQVKDNQLLKSWFPIGKKYLNKVGEIEKNPYETEVDMKTRAKFPFKVKYPAKNVCKTKQCIEAGLIVRSNLNQSVDPCEDFYEFACGGWINTNQEDITTQFLLVSKKLKQQLKEILEAEPDPSDPLPVQAAQVAYRTCIDSETIESQGVEPLTSILDSLGGWPLISPAWTPAQFDMNRLFAQSIRRWSVHHLFSVFVNVDRSDSSRNIITVDQGAPALPRSMLVDPDSYAKQIEAYTQWIIGTAKALAPSSTLANIDDGKLEQDAEEMVKFEMKFAKLTSPPEMRRDATRLQHLISLTHLTEWTDSASTTARSKIKWLSIMHGLFNGTGITIGPNETVNVKELDYLFQLVKLIEETPPNVVANYLIWRIVNSLSYQLTDNLRQLAYDFEAVYTGSADHQTRWEDCVDTINDLVGFAVGYKYVKLHFNEQHKKEVESLVANMKVVLKSRLSSLSWMDPQTRAAAVEKLEAMKEFIGYPDWYNNVTYFNGFFNGISVSQHSHLYNWESLSTYVFLRTLKSLRKTNDRNEWPISPTVVNAFNNIQTNSIIFPAGILQPPFFSLSRPESLNYGSIGIIIGHEIMHGFDDMGRQNDKFGNIVQWWSQQTLETYQSKAECFVQQYGRYRIPELDATLNAPALAKGVATKGENIADNGGLEMGYLAYKKYLSEQGGFEPRIPGLEKFSPEQLFFIGYASNWCESVSTESLLEDYLSGEHSTQRLRVIGAVSNSEQFAKAFNCKAGSPMNPVNKCSIW
ncbi:hypothetical protein M8J77_020003 [Diaphorina citri]|nr:hypothetical protein M8J77_020003 [Diaphorina citri]